MSTCGRRANGDRANGPERNRSPQPDPYRRSPDERSQPTRGGLCRGNPDQKHIRYSYCRCPDRRTPTRGPTRGSVPFMRPIAWNRFASMRSPEHATGLPRRSPVCPAEPGRVCGRSTGRIRKPVPRERTARASYRFPSMFLMPIQLITAPAPSVIPAPQY